MIVVTVKFISSQNNIRECNVRFDDNSSKEEIIKNVTSDVDILVENNIMKKNGLISLTSTFESTKSPLSVNKEISKDVNFEQALDYVSNMIICYVDSLNKRPPKLTQTESLLNSVDKSVVDKFIEEHDISKEKFYSALQTMKDFELFVDKIE